LVALFEFVRFRLSKCWANETVRCAARQRPWRMKAWQSFTARLAAASFGDVRRRARRNADQLVAASFIRSSLLAGVVTVLRAAKTEGGNARLGA
jgi:hypothetical protein